MKKIKYIFLSFFTFLHINKPNEFKNHLRSLIEEKVTNSFSEKSQMAIETDDQTEKDFFISSYEKKIMNHHQTNKVQVFTFNQYNKEDEWGEELTDFILKMENLKYYESKNPLLIYLQNAELLLQQDKKDTIKEFFQIQNNCIKKNIPCYFGIHIGSQKEIDKKIEKSINNKLDLSLNYRLNKNVLFEKCFFCISHLASFLPKKERFELFLPNIKTTALLKFFSELKEKNELIEEKKFYKNLLIASSSKKDIEKNEELITNIAVHETGHALIMHREKTLGYVTIIPTTNINNIIEMGHTQSKGKDHKKTIENADVFYNNIDCLLAGVLAEEAILRIKSTGGHTDKQHATEIARYLINFGLGNKLKIVPQEKNPTFYQEIDELLEQSRIRTKEFINQNKDLIQEISKKLIQEEILFEDDFEEIMREFKAKKS